jgi:3-isopropylmalate/(R)-2-methylmalate dehydratase small subunit
VKNGLLTLELSEAEVEKIFQEARKNPGLEATLHLADQALILHTTPQEISFHFEIDPSVKERFLLGLDDIGITLQEEKAIREFEANHNTQLV